MKKNFLTNKNLASQHISTSTICQLSLIGLLLGFSLWAFNFVNELQNTFYTSDKS